MSKASVWIVPKTTCIDDFSFVPACNTVSGSGTHITAPSPVVLIISKGNCCSSVDGTVRYKILTWLSKRTGCLSTIAALLKTKVVLFG